MYAIVLENKSDIQHFGTPRHSGRYPWGSGKRPYQSSESPPRNETPEQREARKQKVLRTARSATEIKEFADELTYSELDNALKRIDLNQKLDKFVKQEKEAGIRKIDDAMQKVGQINDWTTVGIQSLNNINAIVDLLNSIKTAKEGEYKKYQQYVVNRQKNAQQSNYGASKKKKK